MSATADIYFDKRKKKDGTCNLKIKVTHNRKRRYYATDVNLTPEEFEKIMTAERLRDKQKQIQKKLNKYKAKADEIIDGLNIFTFANFEEQYFEKRNVNKSISYAFDKRIKNLRENDKIGTAITYECAKNSLEAFKKNLQFADVTPELLNAYERKMIGKGNSITTVSMYLRCLRALFNQKDITGAIYPFGKNKYIIPTGKNIKKALTLEEIGMLYNYEAKSGSREQQAQDYWMFLYLCNGMNVKDFCLLKWKNINGEILTYERSKTKSNKKEQSEIKVSLKAETREIMSRWGVKTLSKEDYIFPHLKKGMTAEQQRRVYQDLTKLINKYIKRIAQNVGIEKEVTTYYARHSFATVLKRTGVSTEMISELLGHSNLSVTENYLDSFENEKIHEQTNVLIAGLRKTV